MFRVENLKIVNTRSKQLASFCEPYAVLPLVRAVFRVVPSDLHASSLDALLAKSMAYQVAMATNATVRDARKGKHRTKTSTRLRRVLLRRQPGRSQKGLRTPAPNSCQKLASRRPISRRPS